MKNEKQKISAKEALPTVAAFLERRQKAARNRLPKHLRPPAFWPIGVQMAINLAILTTVVTLMMNQDEYTTESGPAVILVICMVFLISTIINALRMRLRFQKTKGQRW